MCLNEELKKYIEDNVFTEYSKNEKGHQIEHVNDVIHRCFVLSKDINIDLNMLYVIAAYHDIGYHIDYKNHEKVSAQMMYEDKNLNEFFDKEQLRIMKEAIEDHRASLNRNPRSIYGKLISSADRNIDVDESLRRIYFYSIEHFGALNEEETIEECYKHAVEKFGKDGYVKFFLKDKEYENYLKELHILINNKKNFIARLKKIILKTKEKNKQNT